MGGGSIVADGRAMIDAVVVTDGCVVSAAALSSRMPPPLPPPIVGRTTLPPSTATATFGRPPPEAEQLRGGTGAVLTMAAMLMVAGEAVVWMMVMSVMLVPVTAVAMPMKFGEAATVAAAADAATNTPMGTVSAVVVTMVRRMAVSVMGSMAMRTSALLVFPGWLAVARSAAASSSSSRGPWTIEDQGTPPGIGVTKEDARR